MWFTLISLWWLFIILPNSKQKKGLLLKSLRFDFPHSSFEFEAQNSEYSSWITWIYPHITPVISASSSVRSQKNRGSFLCNLGGYNMNIRVFIRVWIIIIVIVIYNSKICIKKKWDLFTYFFLIYIIFLW